MRLLLESAASETIEWAITTRLADGVVVTPGVLDRDAFGVDPIARVTEIVRLTTAPVIVTIGAVAASDLYRVGRSFAKIADHVVLAIPFIEDGLTTMQRLVGDGHRVAANFVATPAQALLAASAGAAYALLLTDALDAHGQDSLATIAVARALFDRHDIECELIACGASAPQGVTAALGAGADGVTLSADALRATLRHPLTDRAVDQMLGELSRRPRPRKR